MVYVIVDAAVNPLHEGKRVQAVLDKVRATSGVTVAVRELRGPQASPAMCGGDLPRSLFYAGKCT
jgi:hypothetical protein